MSTQWKKVRNWSHTRKVAYTKTIGALDRLLCHRAKTHASVRYADGRIVVYPTENAARSAANSILARITAAEL